MSTKNQIPSQEWLEKYEKVKSILVPPVSFEEIYSLIVFPLNLKNSPTDFLWELFYFRIFIIFHCSFQRVFDSCFQSVRFMNCDIITKA